METAYHLRIQPSKNSFRLGLLQLWEFRELLGALALRDIKLRYRQTVLGVAWVILQPLLAAGILAFVFGTVAGITKPDRSSIFIFVLAGFIGWSLFSATLMRAAQSLVQHSALITKVFFPRIVLPASTAISALLDLAVALVLFVLLVLISGNSIGWQLVTLPLWICLLLALSAGLGLVGAALSVRFRDVQHIIPVFVQMLFFRQPDRLSGDGSSGKMARLLHPQSIGSDFCRFTLEPPDGGTFSAAGDSLCLLRVASCSGVRTHLFPKCRTRIF